MNIWNWKYPKKYLQKFDNVAYFFKMIKHLNIHKGEVVFQISSDLHPFHPLICSAYSSRNEMTKYKFMKKHWLKFIYYKL